MSRAQNALDIPRRPLDMQTSRKLFFFFLCLAFISLACLSTVEPYVTYPAETPTLIKSTVSPAITSSPLTPLPTPKTGQAGEGKMQCAVISADEALHLRVGRSEHSRS